MYFKYLSKITLLLRLNTRLSCSRNILSYFHDERKETKSEKRGLLDRLNNDEVVVGDGGFLFALEKRGYVKFGLWTPEAVVEHPEAVRQLHREFLRGGANVMQTFTYYANEDRLEDRGYNPAIKYGVAGINQAACALAREVAAEGDALVCGGISQIPAFKYGLDKEGAQKQLKRQVDVFVEENVDFLLAEYHESVEEIEWTIESCKVSKLPVCASMCIGPEGDMNGVSAGECAVRMAKAGADVVGVNCNFGPFVSLKTIEVMKKALDEAGIKKHLMIQPVAYITPDARSIYGFVDLPEFPFALEPRVSTRWDIHKYTREAYDMGVRYIGGCCGFEPYHIRAICEELYKERGILPEGHEKHDFWGKGLATATHSSYPDRSNKQYWENIKPASGRPFNSAFSVPCPQCIPTSDEILKEKKTVTSEKTIQELD